VRTRAQWARLLCEAGVTQTSWVGQEANQWWWWWPRDTALRDRVTVSKYQFWEGPRSSSPASMTTGRKLRGAGGNWGTWAIGLGLWGRWSGAVLGLATGWQWGGGRLQVSGFHLAEVALPWFCMLGSSLSKGIYGRRRRGRSQRRSEPACLVGPLTPASCGWWAMAYNRGDGGWSEAPVEAIGHQPGIVGAVRPAAHRAGREPRDL
jgi:hypothetical protein